MIRAHDRQSGRTFASQIGTLIDLQERFESITIFMPTNRMVPYAEALCALAAMMGMNINLWFNLKDRYIGVEHANKQRS